MQICKRCRQLFDPSIVPGARDVYVDDYLCSWHPGTPDNVANAGPRDDYADVYRWSCCGKMVPGAVINGRDYPPRRSPGCQKGQHEADPGLLVDPRLSEELTSLQNRLREIEARETTQSAAGGVFVSYSHRDSAFVTQLTCRLGEDRIEFWQDEKDLLVGQVIDRAISEGIQRHALFLIVLTPFSLSSSWVNRELDEASHEAAEGRKIILPVLANGLSLNDLPARIRRFKCADFCEDFDNAYESLKRSIHAHVQQARNQSVRRL